MGAVLFGAALLEAFTHSTTPVTVELVGGTGGGPADASKPVDHVVAGYIIFDM